MSTEHMILQHISGKYYEMIRAGRGGGRCIYCAFSEDSKCSEKGFTCRELVEILGYPAVFKEVEL